MVRQALTRSPTITATWGADRPNRWLVPLGGGVGKVFAIGPQMLGTSQEGYYHVVTSSFGPEWLLRFHFSLLFPK